MQPLPLHDGAVDLTSGDVRRSGGVTRLRPKELEVLRLLAGRADAVGREELLAAVWGYHPDSTSRTLDTTIRRLRASLEADAARPRHVLTEPGVGYRFRPAAPDPLSRHAAALAAVGEPVPDALAAALVPAAALAELVAAGRARRNPDGAWLVDAEPVADESATEAVTAALIDRFDRAGDPWLGPLSVADRRRVEPLLPLLAARAPERHERWIAHLRRMDGALDAFDALRGRPDPLSRGLWALWSHAADPERRRIAAEVDDPDLAALIRARLALQTDVPRVDAEPPGAPTPLRVALATQYAIAASHTSSHDAVAPWAAYATRHAAVAPWYAARARLIDARRRLYGGELRAAELIYDAIAATGEVPAAVVDIGRARVAAARGDGARALAIAEQVDRALDALPDGVALSAGYELTDLWLELDAPDRASATIRALEQRSYGGAPRAQIILWRARLIVAMVAGRLDEAAACADRLRDDPSTAPYRCAVAELRGEPDPWPEAIEHVLHPDANLAWYRSHADPGVRDAAEQLAGGLTAPCSGLGRTAARLAERRR